MIRFQNVSKQFGTDNVVLNNLDFSLDEGDLSLITGPSGSGKTTLMKLLIKQYEPDKGEIFFEDVLINKLRSRHIPRYRRKIGVVFQDYRLINDYNVWENIALPLYIERKEQREIEERVTDLLELVGLEEKAWLFPVQLSGGEAQKVGLARALATGPQVIFADEPTGNLDHESSLSILNLLKKIHNLGTTMLVATHDLVVLENLKPNKHIELIVDTVDEGSEGDEEGVDEDSQDVSGEKKQNLKKKTAQKKDDLKQEGKKQPQSDQKEEQEKLDKGSKSAKKKKQKSKKDKSEQKADK